MGKEGEREMNSLLKRLRGGAKRLISFSMAVMLGVMTIVPYLPVSDVWAADGTTAVLTSAYGDTNLGHKLYCIDHGGLAYYGIAAEGDMYEAHRPSTAGIYVPEQDRRYIFWAMLTIKASLGDVKANSVLFNINNAAVAQGKRQISSMVSEEDLKSLIYLESTRAKYPWLETVAANSEEYMRMGGLLSAGGGGSSVSGKPIPSILANATGPATAVQVDRNTMTLQFDPNGADADFIRTVPIEFSNDNGISYSPAPTDGWTYTKTDTSIVFSNPDPQPPQALVRFNVDGTPYASGGSGYTSELELIEDCLQIWECVQCSGTHTGGTPATSNTWVHQRLVWLELEGLPLRYFAALAGTPTPIAGNAGITFQVFRHEEEFTSNYNVQLYKYDHETGEPLEGSRFALFERFDDKDEVNQERDGAVQLYEGGEPYAGGYMDNPVLWDGFRKVGSFVTDENGYGSQTIQHRYHYDKTFCDGHPAPVFVPVPEPEEDEETGEVLNQGEIDAAQAENREMAKTWLACAAACEEKAGGDFEGVHFHWLMPDVDQGAIEEIAGTGGNEGETPSGGNTVEPDGATSYRESGCQADCQATYDKFIAMKYSYAFSEYQARDGYIRHDVHADDLPIEIITTDSSENGANAAFSGEYSDKESLEAGVTTAFNRAMEGAVKYMQSALETAGEPAAAATARVIPEKMFKKSRVVLQEIVSAAGIPVKTASDSEAEMEELVEYEEIEEELGISGLEEDALNGPGTSDGKGQGPAGTENSGSGPEEFPGSPETGSGLKLPDLLPGKADISDYELPLLKSSPATASTSDAGKDDGNHAPGGNEGKKDEGPKDSQNEDDEDEEDDEDREILLASASELRFQWSRKASAFRSPDGRRDNDGLTQDLFTPAYEASLVSASVGETITPGPGDNYSHCNDADGEGNAWRVYDHRTEGEIHINKKDLDLAEGENDGFDAYGETQGDTTLEGAVYGLFAAADLVHPDGKTGTVYKANDLVAVAATDRDGNASFMVNTEAPGHEYDYTAGTIIENAWAAQAPGNLYTEDITCDDYTEDGQYERTYYDNESKLGNCWIGRPLVMGDYYIKELSRSEGYELSVNNRQNDLTNSGQDLEAKAPENGEGYAVIERQMFADEQTSDDGDGARSNEIFFSAKSRDTKDQTYDIVLTGLPEGVTVYRKDTGTKQIEVEAGTGVYDRVPVINPDGTPKYVTAEHDYQYPKYNADGTMMTQEVPINYVANRFLQVPVRQLDEEKVLEVLNAAEGTMTEEENREMLDEAFSGAQLAYVKGKVETALRKNGKATPRSEVSGGYDYSSIYVGVFDSGIREGDPDLYGLSGVTPGEPAAFTVYGTPVQKIEVAKQKSDGSPLKVSDAILSLLDYYDQNAFYSYGGVDAVEETGDSYVFSVYAGVSGNPENFMVLGSDPVDDSVIYHAVPYIPADTSQPPRYIYADYSNNPAYNAFGTYEDYKEGVSGSSVIGSATLITDAAADEDGNLMSRTVTENVYYKTGELVYDSQGRPIQAYEYREITQTQIQDVEDVKWVKVEAIRQEDGTYVIPVEAAYTDSFGAAQTNDGKEQTIEFKAVLKEKKVTLSAEDAEVMGAGFSAGDVMNSASYYVHVKKARAKAYLDYLNMNLVGDDTYIALVSLNYPGQEQIYQDDMTREKAVQVYERAIRQKIKVVKDIQTSPDGSYAHNTYGYEETDKAPDFRFKAYLKSNLERLYRDEEGTVIWLDRNGNEIPYEELLHASFPAVMTGDDKDVLKVNVPKIFTKVRHDTASTLTSINGNNILADYKDPETFDQNVAQRIPFRTDIASGGVGVLVNAALYSYRGTNINVSRSDTIRAEANKGYTRILELNEKQVESGKDLITVQDYNYDKFFDALLVADTDKWDDKNQTYTSWRPLGNEKKRTDHAVSNAKASDMVRQFAITWYLDDEAAKLVSHNGQNEDEAKKEETENNTTEDIYDEALHEALKKAYDYLTPFFAYDLDEIYAIPWDDAADGGEDSDPATLNASDENGTYFYGVSAYLPYGTYVVAEQQPTKELANKHYKTDRPKEIQVPSVYEAGTNTNPVATLDPHYQYDAGMALTDQAKAENYLIRFGEEWDKNGGDQRQYVIRAHNHDGNFEVYKYGLEPDKLTGTIRYSGGSYEYDGFSITQDTFDPLKDYYNPIHKADGGPLTPEQGANGNSHYFADDENQEITADGGGSYRKDAIEERYHYASVSEQAGEAENIRFEHAAAATPDNGAGAVYKDVPAMQGVQTAYDGLYAPVLVPYTVTEPEQELIYDKDGFKGYADGKFRNTFYTAKLRIEKLDSETHENLLHDGALFMIYKASRDETTGDVLFYETDTLLTGSEEFLKAMGAENITPLKRGGVGTRYSGTVKAGTPVCREEDKIVLPDVHGNDVGQFEAFSTINDVSMKQEDTNMAPNEYRLQTTGYLTTPQPLGAGVYVLCEVPPRGYVRTAPVAIEIYSDKVTYYKEGNRDERVHAAIYEDRPDGVKGNGNKPQDRADTAQIYVENVPIKLQVEKLKKEGTVTFRIGDRIEGTLTEIGGNPSLQYAYDNNGQYLGYAYPKGTLEKLVALKEAGEQVEIVYDGTHFAGYGYVARTRETDDDANPYVAGAKMTLFDAIELTPSGDREDFAYEGLVIERNGTNNITSMFIKQGYAGKKTELVKETDGDGNAILTDYVTGIDENGTPVTEKGYVWTEGTVDRPDTDILYYDLDSLSLTWTENVSGRKILYGWNRNHQKISVAQLMADQENHGKSDRELSLYAFRGGQPYLEFAGGDLEKLSYDQTNKILKGDFAELTFNHRSQEWAMGEGTVVYHLGHDGERDAMVDPYTGMAYVLEPKLDEAVGRIGDRVLVWPVEVAKDENGNVIARDKITTSRIATVGENADGYLEEAVIEPNNQTDQVITDAGKPSYSHRESGYINGTWEPDEAEKSHKEATVNTNKQGQNMNEEILEDINNGDFLSYMSPVYDAHGLVLYYQRSASTYDKGTELYDRNGDFVRYKDSDNLEEYNRAAYALDAHGDLYDGVQDKEHQTQDRLYHRRGESYILENTWMTSDKTPNDPFTDTETAGQPDLLKRLPAGTYILEELEVPEGEGYTKSFPAGVTVDEDAGVKTVQVTDDTTKEYLEKIDGSGETDGTVDLLDMSAKDKKGGYTVVGQSENRAAYYSNAQLSGAELALYPARYIFDAAAPEGYRLEKTSDTPYRLETTNSRTGAPEYEEMTWTTGPLPLYVEGLPEGYYILEEVSVPEGFVKAEPMNIVVENTEELQEYQLFNDHTKVAFLKYMLEGTEKNVLPGAAFTLYEAVTGDNGDVLYDENGHPQYDEDKVIDSWITDDATDYTETIDLKDYPNVSGKRGQTGFSSEFESMYEKYGINGTGFTWSAERTAIRTGKDSNIWLLEDGTRVVTGDGTVTFPPSMSREDRDGFKAAYADMLGEKLTLRWAVTRTAAVTDVETIDASIAGGTAQKYPDIAKVTMTVEETGKTILADVRYNGSGLEYTYKFDYVRLDHVNDHANAWLTADGSRRMDYLPVGTAYVLVETKAPEGFALADPVAVRVEELSGIQLHDVLNERSSLVISKRSSETGKELPGANLALYRADGTGAFNQADEYLVDSWISGTDGVYTETDRINGLVPDGFSEGDLKPHYLYDLPAGTYYLAEVKAPAYYRAAKPLKIEYTGTERIQIERMTDEPVTGELVVHKTDEEGNALAGVVFELSAYTEEGKMVDGFPRKVSDINGTVRIENLPVGMIAPENGGITPYTYKLKEIVPPDGFAVNPVVYTFQFDADGGYTEHPETETIVHELGIENKPTRIYLEKKDLSHLNDAGTDGAFVEGAELVVYKAHIGADGGYIYGEDDLMETWITSKEEKGHLLEGLTAGQTYVWVELEAPAGYLLMKPVLFTVSEDGRSIVSISNNLSAIRVDTVKGSPGNPDSGSITAVTVKGRTVTRTEVEVQDEHGKEILRFTATGADRVIHEEDGLKDGALYTFTEHTIYSDGSDTVTARMTRRVHFEDAGFIYHSRDAVETTVEITDAEGNMISSFTPSTEAQEHTIDNGLSPENPIVSVRSRNQEPGEPLNPSQPVITTITYYNPEPVTQPVTVTAVLGDGASVLDPYSGSQTGETAVTWTIPDVQPYTQGRVSFAASVSDQTAGSIRITVGTEVDGASYQTEKTVPVLQKNRLTIYNELTGSGKELYENEESVFLVRLWDERGNELAGTYSYSGSREGTMRSGDRLSLAGNEFITIDPADFKNCAYEVTRIEDGNQAAGHGQSGTIQERGSGAWFTRSVQDDSGRQIFGKGETYLLTETTRYSDAGSDAGERISSRFSFTLDENSSVSAIGAYDQETETQIEKRDLLTGEAVAGVTLQLADENGTVIAEWETDGEPYDLSGLTPGQRYRVTEVEPAPGYGCALDMTFTVNEDGAPEQLVMEDRQTHVAISKKDITNGEELPGAHLEVIDSDGTVVEEWISSEEPHEIVGVLRAGETYTLRETIPADGFVIANEIEFTVSHDGTVDYVEMIDDTTKVRIEKNKYVETATDSDAVKGDPLKGAVLQILNEDKTPALHNGKEIIFTTGETFTFLEKTLTAGKTYWLHEVEPAPGYAYAEDIKFTVSEDGGVDVVVMEDKPTKAVLSKKAITGEDELPGCEMQLVDENGLVIDQWISGDEPHEITGVLEAGKQYTLIESNPAPGYAYSKDVTFTVNLDGTVNHVEMRDDVTRVEVTKTDRGDRPLAGAQFEILDKDGTVAESWISTEKPHRIEGKLVAGETYILHEKKAPDGYRPMEDIEFTVNTSGEVLGIAAQNIKTGGGGGDGDTYTIYIKKTDEEGNPLAGAAFEVCDAGGNRLSLMRESASTFKLTLSHPQTVTVREIAAPDGYVLLNREYEIKIPKTGDAELLNGDDAFYQDSKNSYAFYAVNHRLENPPEIPVIDSDKGKIIAEYDSGLYGRGRVRLALDSAEFQFAKTGDDFPAGCLALLLGISLAGLTGVIYMQKKGSKNTGRGRKHNDKDRNRGNRGGTYAASVILALIMCMAECETAQAAEKSAESTEKYVEKTYTADTDDPARQSAYFEEMTEMDGQSWVLDDINYEVISRKEEPAANGNMKIRYSAPFTDEEENHVPEREFTEHGITWQLASYEVVETTLNAREEPVSDVIVYEAVPVGTEIPESATLKVTDDVTGEEMGVQVPLRDKWYSRTRWISEFEFPITVTNYSADTFDLNGREISLSQADPLKGYENELLEMIGVSAEDYRIQQIRWDGEPYTDNGVLCRKLSASGEMRVADCHAEYAGVANLPSVEAKTVQAVYTDQPPARAGEQKSKYTYVIKATARYIPAAEPLAVGTRMPEMVVRTVAVAVSILVLIVLAAVFGLLKRRRKKRLHPAGRRI